MLSRAQLEDMTEALTEFSAGDELNYNASIYIHSIVLMYEYMEIQCHTIWIFYMGAQNYHYVR